MGYPRYVSHYHTLETGKEGTLREGPQWTRGPEPWVDAQGAPKSDAEKVNGSTTWKMWEQHHRSYQPGSTFSFFFFWGGLLPSGYD